MSYTATPPTACSRLMEADQAYHDLMRGQVIRAITDENGETMSFTQANADKLLAYIRTLAPQCPSYTPMSLGSIVRTGPVGFIF